MDLVPGRSGTVHENWLAERGEDFRAGVRIGGSIPFHGYKNAIDDQLQDATSVLDAFHQATPTQGRRLAAHLIERLPTCPIPEIARLGRTLRKWKDAFLAYFDTGGASNGPTEAINGIIELVRGTARGYRNPTNYQLRMLLIAGGLDASTHT